MSFVAAPRSRRRVLRRMTLPNGRWGRASEWKSHAQNWFARRSGRRAENSSHPRRIEVLVLGSRSNLNHGENTAVEFGEKATR